MSGRGERWLAFAAEDLKAGEALVREQVWSQACFHAQQCVEKALKAVIAERSGGAPPRIHAIAELLEMIPEGWFVDLRSDLREILDDYYLPTRYPDAVPGTLPTGLPAEEEAREAIELARKLFQEVGRLLGLSSD
jgi:HEPN domain-containing protein